MAEETKNQASEEPSEDKVRDKVGQKPPSKESAKARPEVRLALIGALSAIGVAAVSGYFTGKAGGKEAGTEAGTEAVAAKKVEVDALKKDLISIASTHDDQLPIGVVLAFGGADERIPPGWLACDGQSYSDAQYPELYRRISISWGKGDDEADDKSHQKNFRVPDLRGLFLRGVDPSHKTDLTNRSGGRGDGGVGSTQGYATAEPNDAAHPVRSANDSDSDEVIHLTPTGTAGYRLNDPATRAAKEMSVTHIQPRWDRETVPKNAAVRYIIHAGAGKY